MTEAAAQLQKGLDYLALLPDGRERQRQELELWSALAAVVLALKGYAAQETGHAYVRARELWEQLGSPSEFLHVPYGQSYYHTYRSEFDLALPLGEDLLRMSRKRNDSAGLVLGHVASGRSLLFVGRLALSRSHMEQGLAIYNPISHRSFVHQFGIDPQAILQSFLGLVLFCLGYPEQASARARAAIADARAAAHPPTLCGALSFGFIRLSFTGDVALDPTFRTPMMHYLRATNEWQGYQPGP